MASSVASLEAMTGARHTEGPDVHIPTTMRSGKYVGEQALESYPPSTVAPLFLDPRR
jgi:hypothetical protein